MLFLTLDFESCNRKGDWWACGLVLASYPEFNVMEKFQVVCQRPRASFDKPTWDFWQQHPAAYKNLTALGVESVTSCERQIVEFTAKLIHRYPRFTVISDNPQFDLRLFDNILISHGGLPLAHRCPGKYLFTVCTHTYLKLLRQMYFISSSHYIPHAYKSELYILLQNHVLHTPLHDCAQALLKYLSTLHIN